MDRSVSTERLALFDSKLQAGRPFRNQCVRSQQSWSDVVAFFLQRMPSTLTAEDGTVVAKEAVQCWFSDLLGKMAAEFLQPETQAEYNAVKHGFRGLSDAVSLTIVPEGGPTANPARIDRLCLDIQN